jgi:siroheme synthase-like protein
MIDIEDKLCLIVGGGKIALHKAGILLEYGVRIKLVAPDVSTVLSGLDGETAFGDRIDISKRKFCPEDLENVDFVVVATDDIALGEYISGLCREKGILVNVVDEKEECSFIFPAIIKQRDMVVAVSTGGNSPAGAGYIKRRIDDVLPEYYGDMVSRLGAYRDYIFEKAGSPGRRKQIFNALLEYGDSHGGDIPREVVDRIVSDFVVGDE